MDAPDIADIKARIAAGQHVLDGDPGMHTDDMGALWLQGYGDLWPRVHIPQLVKRVEVLERGLDERLEAAFSAMRKDGNGLTLSQEQAIKAATRAA
jgi:hypothetical protein